VVGVAAADLLILGSASSSREWAVKPRHRDAHLVKPVDPDVLRRILAEGDGADHPTDDRQGPLTTERQ
jgi:hypothetical protein